MQISILLYKLERDSSNLGHDKLINQIAIYFEALSKFRSSQLPEIWSITLRYLMWINDGSSQAQAKGHTIYEIGGSDPARAP